MPGQYGVTETGVSGWELTGLSCNDTSNTTTDLATATASINLDPGESVYCTLTNTRDTGSITVNKVIDADGDLTTTEDQNLGVGWEFDVNGAGIDTSDPLAASTDATGAVSFSSLKTGQYNITETLQPGYDLIAADCGLENGSLDGNTLYSSNVTKDATTTCTFYNTPNGTIHGYKWSDLNGNGERDCIEEEEGSESQALISDRACESEPMLPGWTINLYAWNGEGYDSTPIRIMDTDSGGRYWFEHLFPGQYKVCEEQQTGWTQTYPINENGNCYLMTLPDGNSSQFPVSLNDVNDPEYKFGNQFILPELTIEKFNDQWPTVQDQGDVVDYTITIRASKNNVNDVIVKDLMPNGFSFNSITSVVKNGSDSLSVPDPDYHSPGTWKLGDMKDGDEIVIKFKGNIGSSQQPGTYKDLAWAEGISDISKTPDVLATSVNAPTPDKGTLGTPGGNFVGTQIALAVPGTPQNVELENDTERETKTRERVLGVTTYLPATGSSTGWIVLILILLIAGVGLILFDRRRKEKANSQIETSLKVLFFALLTAGILSSQVAWAIAPSIRLEQPTTPTNIKNLNIGFVVLDIEGRSMYVECFKQGPGEISFSSFDTVGVAAGGNSGTCDITLLTDGEYKFYATVSAGGDSSTSESLKVALASAAPDTPLNYDRDDDSCTVTFQTANDGLTAKVELYRSVHDEFVADASTFAQSKDILPNTDGSLTDPLGNCDDYYYVIRAVSEAGIGSGFVGDEDVNVETRTRTRTRTEETIVRTGGGAILTEGGTVAGETEGETGEEGMVQGEENIEGGTGAASGKVAGEEEGEVVGIFGGKNAKYWWGAGLLALGLAYYLYRRKGKTPPPASAK